MIRTLFYPSTSLEQLQLRVQRWCARVPDLQQNLAIDSWQLKCSMAELFKFRPCAAFAFLFSGLCFGMPTATRMHVTHYRPCCFCTWGPDSLVHYMSCPIVWDFVSQHLGLPRLSPRQLLLFDRLDAVHAQLVGVWWFFILALRAKCPKIDAGSVNAEHCQAAMLQIRRIKQFRDVLRSWRLTPMEEQQVSSLAPIVLDESFQQNSKLIVSPAAVQKLNEILAKCAIEDLE